MAQLELKGFDDMLEHLRLLEGDTDRIAKKMVNSSLPILKRALQSSYGKYEIGKHLRIVKAKKAKNGSYIGVVTPKGNTDHYRFSYGDRLLSRAELAVFLEYGVREHDRFPALPPGGYMAKAVASSKEECEAKMEEVYWEEVEKYSL